ncbi:MAG: xanthine dehydrogenase family protein [Deltaproteobacteria bacterium]|nr:xanthine dehydrogenase family protein [Deltaproteobacteria bacterium]
MVPGRSRIVGDSPVRKDAFEKVTGKARFVDDLSVEGAWVGRTVRSSEAHARLRAIRFDPAFDWSTVVVVTAADIPGENVIAAIADDQPCLVDGVIRHAAEPVAVIAAPDDRTAGEALRHVSLDTESLTPVLDHESSDQALKSYEILKGDVERGLAEADLIVEGTYRVGHQEQMYIEPQGIIAIPRQDGMLVQGSLQCPFYVHKALTRVLGLAGDEVVVAQTVTGGAFGGKEEYPSMIAAHAALAARKAGRPVRIVYDRREDVRATTKRHPATVRHRTGVMRDGRIVAMDVEVVMDGGAYVTLTPVVLSRGTIHAAGAYRCANTRIRSRAVMTNTPPNGAFRGFGAPQTLFAVERQMDRVARALGLSPLEVRRKNLIGVGDTTATGQLLTDSVGAREVLEAVATAGNVELRHAELENKPRVDGAHLARGLGLSVYLHGAGFTGSGEAHLRGKAAVALGRDGRFEVQVGSTEMGQGARTVLAQIAAEELGVPLDDVDVVTPDTSIVPDSGPTVASRTTMIVGSVVREAAAALGAELGAAYPSLELRAAAREHAIERGPLRVLREYRPPPDVRWDDAAYRGDAYPVYGYGANVVEVEVDLDTLQVEVTRCLAAADVGKAIHPQLVEGQVQGGTLQALAWGYLEELVLKDGRVQNDRMTNYLIPTTLDTPPIETILVERPYVRGPFGAKGVGELPMDGAAAALASAISQALGVEVDTLPATPERLLDLVRGSR